MAASMDVAMARFMVGLKALFTSFSAKIMDTMTKSLGCDSLGSFFRASPRVALHFSLYSAEL